MNTHSYFISAGEMMGSEKVTNASEEEARALAEESRENWQGRSFVREIFMGKVNVNWIHPYPKTPESDEFKRFYCEMEHFLKHDVDSIKIDATGEYGDDVVLRLKEMGAFGIKIDKKYGGLGFTQDEYCKVCELLGTYDSNITALISAHNSIGVPQPVKLFGSDALKQKYLPQCAAGAISAFALTEPDAGSDPARLTTSATRTESGDYIINGEKLWITNGTFADLMVVMARNTETDRISAFVVEMDWPGITIGHRCTFMGLKALQNGIILFKDVRVPAANLIGAEGKGLKIALVTLNTGRLSLPAAAVGGSRGAVDAVRSFGNERVQWGKPIGRHEAITHKIADMTAKAYAMESWSHLSNELSMRPGYDIRLEAATAKEWASTRAWDIVDDAMQIRGGRGYETEASLIARGEEPVAIERAMRDSRINRIFEGSSEIMHLFMAREMVDQHLQVAGTLLDPKATLGKKIASLPKLVAFYALWYPRLWLGPLSIFKYWGFGKLGRHLRYADRASRRLARNVFHGMVIYAAKLERKQMFLFRTVDIAMELSVMIATIVRTQKLVDEGHPHSDQAVRIAELFSQNARYNISDWFRGMWRNNDAFKYKVGIDILDSGVDWFTNHSRQSPEAAQEVDSAQSSSAA